MGHTINDMGEPTELSLVMSGGGARAAYQVGFLRGVARVLPNLRIDILTGISAGAINAAYLAAAGGSFAERVEGLAALWATLQPDQVFRTDARALGGSLLRAATRLVSGGHSAPSIRGMVDTRPLQQFLNRALKAKGGNIPGIARNIEAGRLKAFAVSTTSYTTGQTITWVQGRNIQMWERPNRRSAPGPVTVAHIMASSALPFFFPAIEIDGRWYGDGGIRMLAPFSPAVHLGAGRIFAISTRYIRSMSEAEESIALGYGYPPPAQVLGVLMNSMFLDFFDHDALQLERLNALILRIPELRRGELRPVDLFMTRPSANLGKLANDYEPDLPKAFRFLTRGLGTNQMRSNDALSLVMFQSDYLRRLIATGEADAKSKQSEIEAFLAPWAS